MGLIIYPFLDLYYLSTIILLNLKTNHTIFFKNTELIALWDECI